MIDVEPIFIKNIMALRKRIPNIITFTLTLSNYHLEVLVETISLFKSGYRFMPVVGASAVVESCLLSKKRRDSNWNTWEEYNNVGRGRATLSPLIREYIDNPIIPIGELRDKNEDLNKIKERKAYPNFAQLRNKFAHGDILKLASMQTEFFSLLPELEELREKYDVKINNIYTIRWDLPSYIQITKCLNFLIKWQYNLSDRNR
jgi:hypothetical protein